MKISFPIKHTVAYLPNSRCKKYRHQVVTCNVELPVQKVTDEAKFPIAFKVTEYQTVLPKVRDSEQAWELCQHGNGGKGMYFTETIRRFGKKLFKPVRHSFGSAIARSFEDPIPRLMKEVEWFQNSSNFDYVGHGDEEPKYHNACSVIDMNSTETRKSVARFLKDFVIFDGILWENVSEPLYTYTTFGLGNNHGGTGFFIEYGRRCHASKDIYWKADKRDQAIKAAVEAALDRGDTESVKWIRNAKENIEVVNG